jgi:hypothetical protein
MNCDTAFCIASVFGRCLSVPVEDPSGACHLGRGSRAAHLYSVGRLDPNHDAVMRIGVGLQPTGLTRGEAPGGGPILSVGNCATSATGSRHLGSSTGSPRSDASSGRRIGKEMISRRLFSLPDAE